MPTGVLLDWIAGHKLITEWPTKCTLSEASEPDLEQTTAKQLRTGHSLPRKSQYRLPAMWTVWACIAFWVSLLIRYNLSSGNYGIHFFISFFGGKDDWHYWNCAIYLQCYNHDAYDQTSNQRHLLFRSSTWWILFSHLSGPAFRSAVLQPSWWKTQNFVFVVQIVLQNEQWADFTRSFPIVG